MQLRSIPSEQKCELIWLETMPQGEMLNFCKGKIVFISTELVPKFKLVGQRYAHETSILCSNLYFVYQGRLTGVRVPAHGAEFFNKKLRQVYEKIQRQ